MTTTPKKAVSAPYSPSRAEARLDAQAAVLDKLVDALAAATNGTYDVEVLKREIREAVDSAGGEAS